MAVEVTLVWQLVEATASAYKALKICHFVGFKKIIAIVCVFLRKAPTKSRIRRWVRFEPTSFRLETSRPSSFNNGANSLKYVSNSTILVRYFSLI